jgi:hypothetical protein
VILIDANLMIYAYHRNAPQHERARAWLESTFATEDVGIALTTALAFVRITTRMQPLERPISAATAIGVVRSWLTDGGARLVTPTDRHWQVFQRVATEGQARGPLLMDAHLAALAIEHGATLATSDRDFTRFPGLRLQFPLAG